MSEVQTLSQKLLAVQRKIGAVARSSTNPHFRSTYADLNAVLETSKRVLNEVGIVISQIPGADAFGKYLETTLIDGDSAQQLQCRVYFSGNEDNMQKIGAAITYARRFGLKSLLAMEDTDDDGEAAVGRGANSDNANNQRSGGQPNIAVRPQAAPIQAEVPTAGPTQTKGEIKRQVLQKQIEGTVGLLSSLGTPIDELKALLKDKYGVTSSTELDDKRANELLTELKAKLPTKKEKA